MPATYSLPEGWKLVPLGEIAEIVGGGTPPREKSEYFNGDIVWLTPTEIPKDRITVISDSREKITKDGLKNSSARVIPKNSVLMTSRASIGYVAIAGKDVTTNQGFASFICNDHINNYFLAYWLFANADFFKEQATGTTFKEIIKSKLRNFVLPLPPIEEQEQIVAKIEELFTQLDAGVAALKRARAALKRYKASVLKAAVEGRLVPQDPSDEPAEEMLRRLGKKPLERGNNRLLPNTWSWIKLEDCVEILDSKRIPINADEREKRIFNKNKSQLYPYYGATGQVGWIDDYIFDDEILLLGEDGAPFLDTGKEKAYIVYGKCWVNNHAHVLKAINGITTNLFLIHYLNIFDYNGYVTGTTRLKLNQAQMKSIIVALPPLAEQKYIVSEIERRFFIVKEIERLLETTFVRGGRLRQAILKQAFEGRLT